MMSTPYERMLSRKAKEQRALEQARREHKKRVSKELAARHKELSALRKAKSSHEFASKLYWEVERAIGASFPDCDPDLGPILRKYDVTMADLDRAVRKFHNMRRGGVYTWLAQMWDETAADRMFDAKNGYVDENSPFYYVDEQGNIVKHGNPWK